MNSGKMMKLAESGRNTSMMRMVEESNPYEQIVGAAGPKLLDGNGLGGVG